MSQTIFSQTLARKYILGFPNADNVADPLGGSWLFSVRTLPGSS
jgi:hypothetical protein